MEYILVAAYLFALFVLNELQRVLLIVGTFIFLYFYKTGFPPWLTESFGGVAVIYWLAAPFLVWWLIAYVFVSVFAPKKD